MTGRRAAPRRARSVAGVDAVDGLRQVECPLARLLHLLVAEPREFLGDLFPQVFAAVTTLLRQPAERKQGAGRSAGCADRAGAVNDQGLLHVRVVEVSEHALQFLERSENALHVGLAITG